MPSITTPEIQHAPHWITTEEIAEAYRDLHPEHPRLEVWLRMVRATGVVTRPWLLPLASAGSDTGVGPRSRAAYSGSLDLAVAASRRALAAAELQPGDIDAVVTSHTSSYTVPGLDVDVVRRLALRPDVSRVGLATVACAGGAHALVQAARIAQERPGARVLVVVAEQLSTLYHPHLEPSLQQVLYAGLFGDSAGAAIVSGDAAAVAGPHLPVGDSWEYLLPDSADAYWGVIDTSGITFDSTPKHSGSAPAAVVPALTSWLANGPPPQWAVVHPGGPGIITTVLQGLRLDDEKHGAQSRASLSTGNLGGVAVLDVLARTLTAPTAPEGEGVLVAFGPGFAATALRLGPARASSTV
ncbi:MULTISPECIES: PhlD [unclassified Streptomyces]|uniref:PhlD n=1 Tax=unclassified Streptomyces TaxID=2593676 RepID=UPI000CD4D452|nr:MULTISPECIES: PhlD [unclassified Streptomyces]